MGKNRKYNVKSWLFVVSGVLVFFILVAGYMYSVYFLSLKSASKVREDVTDRYYLNEDFKDNDPFITRNARLSDMLLGPIISERDPSYGDIKADVVIVRYSDFECKYCRDQENVVRDVVSEYKGKIGFVWKDYPEYDYDSKSFKAALAARCAAEQGKFWEYHDGLYEEEVELNERYFGKMAMGLGLDSRKFEKCYKGSKARRLIEDNIEEANALGIKGVPFMFINDQEVMGEITADDLRDIINKEMKKKNDE